MDPQDQALSRARAHGSTLAGLRALVGKRLLLLPIFASFGILDPPVRARLFLFLLVAWTLHNPNRLPPSIFPSVFCESLVLTIFRPNKLLLWSLATILLVRLCSALFAPDIYCHHPVNLSRHTDTTTTPFILWRPSSCDPPAGDPNLSLTRLHARTPTSAASSSV